MNNILKSFIITALILTILILIIYLTTIFEYGALIIFGAVVFIIAWTFVYMILDDF